MRRIHGTVVLAVLLAFGLSVAISPEDLPETSYDESEPAPYEATPQISTLMLMQSARFASDAGRLVLPSARLLHFRSILSSRPGSSLFDSRP